MTAKTKTVPPRRGGVITLVYGRVDAEGRRRCCCCGQPVPKGRRDWCGKECVRIHAMDQDWRRIRQAVTTRDRCQCRDCGSPLRGRKREVHHITPVAAGGTNDLENLVLLCGACHAKRHGKGE